MSLVGKRRRKWVAWRSLLPLTVFVLCQKCGNAAGDRPTCSLRHVPPIMIVFDEEKNGFVRVTNDTMDDQGGRRRSLHFLRTHNVPAVSLVQDDNVVVVTRELEDGITVRQCTCSLALGDNIYCPVEKENCGVDIDRGYVGCFNHSAQTTLIRNVWPFVMVWYAVLGLFLVLTEQGRNVRNYVIRTTFNPDLNEGILDQILSNQDYYRRRRLWQRRFHPRLRLQGTEPTIIMMAQIMQASSNPPEATPNPTQLALKTKRYHTTTTAAAAAAADSDSEDEADAHTCTICFGPLCDGDRVGALPCQHHFHVECLKTWLPRRNACPLCAVPAALPQFQQDDETRSETTSNQQPDPPPPYEAPQER